MKAFIQLIVVAFLIFVGCSKEYSTMPEDTLFNPDQQISLAKKATKDFLKIHRTNTAPIIDGMPDEAWENAPKIKFRIIVNETGPLDSKKDLYAFFKMMWNDDNIYLFVFIWDDEINVSNPAPWFNDGIELFFDGDNSKNDLSEYPDQWPFAYDSNDDQLRFIFDQNPTSTYSHIDVSAFDVSYLPNKEGYNIEAALPFDALLFPPTIGHVFGFEIAVMDNDLGVRQNCLRWWSNEDGEITWKDPSLFGTDILFD